MTQQLLATRPLPVPAKFSGPVKRMASSTNLVLVDGLNMIRLCGASPKLERILIIARDLAYRGGDFGCVFDANTFFVLREAQGREHAEAYHRLLRDFGDFFLQVTGGTQADDLILREADARMAQIVSNDRFTPYLNKYPWLKDDNRVMRVNRFRDNIHFDGRRFSESLDLRELLGDVEDLLAA